MSFAAVTAALCGLAFAALFLFTLVRGTPSREGRFVLAASAATALWAFGSAFGMAPGRLQPLETAQTLIWLALLEFLLRPQAEDSLKHGMRRLAVIGGVLAGVTALANDLVHLDNGALVWSQIVTRAGLAIAGLLLVENLYRNIEPKRLWNVVPFCIGIGGFFAYGLFLYSTALLTGHVNPVFADARSAATCLSAPFLALTLARNRNWRIDHHISRSLVFHAFTLVVSGVFLLVVASLGAVLQQHGGWGPAAQVVTLFGSALVLTLVLSSGGIKARINYLVSRNLFSLRYDYRVEWMNFIDILSAPGDGAELRQRVIHAVANIVDSPRGALWLIDEDVGFRPAAFFNLRLPAELIEPLSGAFVAGFRGGHWIQVFDGEVDPAPWRADGQFWLAVPLVHSGHMIGFIALAHPRAPLDLNWESFELLRAVGHQAASYICEETAARQLADARRLEDYGKRFAFLGHDLKTLASQLRLIAVNAQRHGDDPGFRADAFRTVETASARMNALLLQLHARTTAAAEPQRAASVDAARIVAEVAGALAGAAVVIETRMPPIAARVAMPAENLRSALTHVVSNAVEASPPGAAVSVAGTVADDRLAIEVADHGPGMDPEFVRNELFRPFRTTKTGGSGIGAYQTRELVRAAGGELDVISQPGAGTTMRIVLPLAREGAVPSAA
ncbi:MAG: PEP-CTERM system histidine kinase PrsK [Alphaproteobacteria bacterium]|nr:PEP-CTERM system histidine kinase PrsK [Alphaproteobacteria bacterium]